ncbi:MAG: MFS transporter [Bdellovibrionota bacterium]
MFKDLFRKETFSWAFYDWANSAFATSIMAGFFPLFFKSYWNVGVEASVSTVRLGFTNAAASLVIAVLAPFIGAFADEAGTKKKFLFWGVLLGSLATMAFAVIGEGDWMLASGCYVLAIIAFSVTILFYDALLPSISTPQNVDFVSSGGYALGYLGGGILLLVNVLMLQHPQAWGLADKTMAVKASFVSVGIWWFVFSFPLFFFVKEPFVKREQSFLVVLRKTTRELGNTVKKLIRMKEVLYFMMAYWLYIDGVQTIVKMAVDFGVAIGFKSSDLIFALLIVQFVGFPAGFLFGYLGQRWDAKKAILIGIFCYVIVVFWAIRMETVHEFYMMATLIGLVQGCVQALSRSLYTRLIPAEHAGEFFGFYNLVGKAASVLGPALVGIVTYVSGSNRWGISSLLILLVCGGSLLFFKVQNPQQAPVSP